MPSDVEYIKPFFYYAPLIFLITDLYVIILPCKTFFKSDTLRKYANILPQKLSLESKLLIA